LIDQGHEAAFVPLDIANEASVQASVDFTIKTFGTLDVAVNCAGIGGPSLPAHQIPADKWQQVIDIDLTGTFYFTKAVTNYWLTQEPRLIRHDVDLGLAPVSQRGALVNVASINALLASKNMGGYGERPFWRDTDEWC
jgi:NAD(P)-dependent dehydrogenase (short-subunit alcohol dehydrogenase family)